MVVFLVFLNSFLKQNGLDGADSTEVVLAARSKTEEACHLKSQVARSPGGPAL